MAYKNATVGRSANARLQRERVRRQGGSKEGGKNNLDLEGGGATGEGVGGEGCLPEGIEEGNERARVWRDGRSNFHNYARERTSHATHEFMK